MNTDNGHLNAYSLQRKEFLRNYSALRVKMLVCDSRDSNSLPLPQSSCAVSHTGQICHCKEAMGMGRGRNPSISDLVKVTATILQMCFRVCYLRRKWKRKSTVLPAYFRSMLGRTQLNWQYFEGVIVSLSFRHPKSGRVALLFFTVAFQRRKH